MERYSRQTALTQIGVEGQKRLSYARVLIVGAGGLGSPIALYLAAAGVGTIGIIDDDKVSLDNLQRQILYTQAEQGVSKVEAAAHRLQALNSTIDIITHNCRLEEHNATQIISGYDIVLDGCDNLSTRLIIDRICASLNKVYIYGAIEGLIGQVSVFKSGITPPLSQLFDTPPHEPSKAVLGATAGIIGSIEAAECIKIICNFGEPLYNRLWRIDLTTMQTYIIDL